MNTKITMDPYDTHVVPIRHDRNTIPTDHVNVEFITIECVECLETRQLDGKNKITTLLCGHHFCTACILKRIARQLSCCPVDTCRSCVFETPGTTPVSSSGELSHDLQLHVPGQYTDHILNETHPEFIGGALEMSGGPGYRQDLEEIRVDAKRKRRQRERSAKRARTRIAKT